MSSFHGDKNSTTENEMSTDKNGQRNIEPVERMRRLIPYMTFYIPTQSRDYLPYGPITKQMVIETKKIDNDDGSSLNNCVV